jgi:signal transduction histidine kinase
VTFRSRLLLAAIPLALLPLLLLAFGVRREVGQRMRTQYETSVDALAGIVEDDLEREGREIATKLGALAASLADDNRLRLALASGMTDRAYLLDYAAPAMKLSGLDALQVHDENGRILSSGHFRNDFDRVDAATPAALRAAAGRALVGEVRTAEGTFPALLRIEEAHIGARTLTLVGGTAVDAGFLTRLQRGEGLSVALVYPGGTVAAGDSATTSDRADARAEQVQREIPLAFVPAAATAATSDDSARFVIAQSFAELEELRTSIDAWFLAAAAGAAALALLLALLVASRVSRPLSELAQQTQRLDLDRLDVDFAMERNDEIGALGRTLSTLALRLRASAGRLRDAERRATVGEIARQVHHDVRNGLTPIRNVVEHLSQVARENPSELPRVFTERQATLDASISYLHSLAANYARLSPRLERKPCDVNAIVREVLRGVPEQDRDRVRAELAATLPPVTGDPIALRRIIENLVRNALESLEPIDSRQSTVESQQSTGASTATGKKGSVIVSTSAVSNHDDRRVHIVVADSGRGMTKEQLEKIFDDFYTTKERGTGLGLSIVRRLVSDLGGSVRVESQLGKGTRFRVELPSPAVRTVDSRLSTVNSL